MKLIEQLQQLERLDGLIRRKATGTPKELARKFSVSERTIYNLLQILKELGAEIDYCHVRRSYFYESPMKFRYGFTIESSEEKKLGGGKTWSSGFWELQNFCSNYLDIMQVATRGMQKTLPEG